jgi:hypothetical protein
MTPVDSFKKTLLLSLFSVASICSAFSEPHDSISVKNVDELKKAVSYLNQGRIKNIVLKPGTYQVFRRLKIDSNNVTISGASDDATDVVISGNGMEASKSVGIIFDISGSHVTIRNLTLQETSNHLIQVRAEKNADNFHLSNVRLLNSYEQMVKVSGGPGTELPTSDYGIIENCIFEYTSGIGPQFYIGGIDAHRAHHWLVKNNTFKNIASPSKHVAEHAIHFWNYSKDNRVVENRVINSDRAIGFGMNDRPHQNTGGVISGNIIVHSNTSHPFSDAGIVLESSPGTIVKDNQIFMDTHYPNAIEYRYESTSGVVIQNNDTNRRIVARDGATAVLVDNNQADWFEGVLLNLRYLFFPAYG